MTAPLICVYCGKVVEHDTDAERWMRQQVLVDMDVVDVDNPGTWCEAEDDFHRVEAFA